MKTIIVKNSRIPKLASIFINVYAITIFPFIFLKDEGDKDTLRHERIHIEQQRELWLIPFYVLYVWYWLKGRFKGMNSQEAYMNIPFEREAYIKSYDPRYLLKRKKYAWKKYL